MGWSEGKGLGKHEQGADKHVEHRKRGDNVGLGADATVEAQFAAGLHKGSAKAAFGDLKELARDARQHLDGDLPGYNVKPSAAQEPVINIRKLSDAEEDVIEYRMRSWRGVDDDQAESIQSSLRRTASGSAHGSTGRAGRSGRAPARQRLGPVRLHHRTDRRVRGTASQ